jgi:hypothetical protein
VEHTQSIYRQTISSGVGIVTMLQAGWQGVRMPAEVHFLFFNTHTPALTPTQPPTQWVPQFYVRRYIRLAPTLQNSGGIPLKTLNVKFTQWPAMKARRGSIGIALLFLWPDRPACSESLYRLSYPDQAIPHTCGQQQFYVLPLQHRRMHGTVYCNQ